jgi:hypothetical protein
VVCGVGVYLLRCGCVDVWGCDSSPQLTQFLWRGFLQVPAEAAEADKLHSACLRPIVAAAASGEAVPTFPYRGPPRPQRYRSTYIGTVVVDGGGRQSTYVDPAQVGRDVVVVQEKPRDFLYFYNEFAQPRHRGFWVV